MQSNRNSNRVLESCSAEVISRNSASSSDCINRTSLPCQLISPWVLMFPSSSTASGQLLRMNVSTSSTLNFTLGIEWYLCAVSDCLITSWNATMNGNTASRSDCPRPSVSSHSL